ncbi:MAG: hypothetical protein IKK85_04425 [Clostridia bacterium]|nr:hypothetical protein [Clostridia bacterium]
MQQLVMNKKIIRGAIDFAENFSAKDVLFNRNIAAGFFVNKLYYISPTTRYHTEMFLQLQFFTPYILASFSKPSDYLTEAKFARGECSDEKRKQLQRLMEEEKLLELAEKTWAIAQATGLEDSIEKIKLFCMLTAAYALARRSPDENGFEISPEQAECAYLGKPEPDSSIGAKELIFTEVDTVINLPAREQPYEIHLQRSEAVKLLENGSRITHKKLIAAPHIDGRNGVSLTMHIYSENSNEFTVINLAVGEYRFINAVGEYPVLVHTAPKCGLTDDILSYAEQYPGSYVTVRLTENGGTIDDSQYKDRANAGLGKGTSAVEFAFEKGHYVYLTPDGFIRRKVCSSEKNKRYAAIEDYLKDKRREDK